MSFVNVKDGFYTGIQIHSSPELRDLLEYVPRHRAHQMIIEVKGGAVIEEIRTKTSLASFAKANGSARAFLAENGIEVLEVEKPVLQPQAASLELTAALKANEELRGIVNSLLTKIDALQKQPEPVAKQPEVEKEPEVEAKVESGSDIPSYRDMQQMQLEDLQAIAAKHKSEIIGDIKRLNITQLRSQLNRIRIKQEG